MHKYFGLCMILMRENNFPPETMHTYGAEGGVHAEIQWLQQFILDNSSPAFFLLLLMRK